MLSASLACLLLAACTAEKEPDFCRNHAQFHADHSATNARLRVEMTSAGDVTAELRLPTAITDQQSATAILRDAENVFTLQSESRCAATESVLEASADSVLASYSSRCGADNKLGQVDVRLFDTLPGLNEVEVSVVTPATQKHFAINRQCETAIFRLK